jgi:hypothetical protein
VPEDRGLQLRTMEAWPAVALVGSYELLMMIIRSAPVPEAGTALRGVPERLPVADPLQ